MKEKKHVAKPATFEQLCAAWKIGKKKQKQIKAFVAEQRKKRRSR